VIRVVNMIPRSLSNEENQDSEPSVAVNPANPQEIVGTAFTPDPLGGPLAPVFVSTDGGVTWALHTIVPGGSSTADISLAFAGDGGALYGGILARSDVHLNVLRTSSPLSPTPMKVLDDRAEEDQPWTVAATVKENGASQDRVFIGHNDFNAGSTTASVELSDDARAAGGGFATHAIEQRKTSGQDGPPIRVAIHPSGVVYAAFHRWVKNLSNTQAFVDREMDVVVTRDDDWGRSNPFTALVDPNDNVAGVRVATGRFVRFTTSIGPLGQERIGGDLSIAVDPNDAAHVWVAWCDRVGGANGTDWTMHVRHSTDSGETWSDDVHQVENAKNPALAVNASGVVALMYQQLAGVGAASSWVTQIVRTSDAFATDPSLDRLHIAPFSIPKRIGLPYLGDYIRLVALDNTFYGVFSGSNVPDQANFPNGVVYQRNVNFATKTLLSVDGARAVAPSIDPFFVTVS
jgi:hypothetical protein